MPFYPLLGEGIPTTIDYTKSWDPYSNLATGGPSRTSNKIRYLGTLAKGLLMLRVES